MKNDEFAFFNQQLAAMLRDGIPLEGALQRLCADMRQGALRTELERLGADLARGTPLPEAVRARQLPELYQRVIEVGVKGNDLPGVLTMLADHYERSNALWTRLKGLMVYPLLVLTAAFLLSCFLAYVSRALMDGAFVGLGFYQRGGAPGYIMFGPWVSPVVLGILVLAMVVAATTPLARRALRWRIPAFREAGLAQIASALSLMLKSGVSLDNALGLVGQLERGTRAEPEVNRWRQNLAAGRDTFYESSTQGKVVPPLFVWMMTHAGEDMAAGFEQVAETFKERAAYRSDMMLYSALPVAILGLGLMIVLQVTPVVLALTRFMASLSGD